MTGNEKLVLSGGGISRYFLGAIQDLSGVSEPRMLLDISPSANQQHFENQKAKINKFLEIYGVTRYSWLQYSFEDEPSPAEAAEQTAEADVLWIMGGSTRRVYNQWQKWGVSELITDRVADGSLVGCGGSAGAMIWFERGYSDSRQYEVPEGSRWNHVKVPGVEVVPAWVTAHYSDTDGFGRQRDTGFKRFLGRHEGEWQAAIGLETCATMICAEGIAQVIDVRGAKANPMHAAHVFSAADGLKPEVVGHNDTLSLYELADKTN